MELGGVTECCSEALVEPDGPQVEKRLLAIKQRAAQTTGSKQFFFCYAGHSDERGLLLFGSHVDDSRLRISYRIDRTPGAAGVSFKIGELKELLRQE